MRLPPYNINPTTRTSEYMTAKWDFKAGCEDEKSDLNVRK